MKQNENWLDEQNNVIYDENEKKLSDPAYIEEIIFKDPSFITSNFFKFDRFGAEDVCTLVSTAMAKGNTKALLVASKNCENFGFEELKTTMRLFNEKMNFSYTHGGIGNREATRINNQVSKYKEIAEKNIKNRETSKNTLANS